MPYSSVSELPSEVTKKYTSKQQSAFRKAFNNAVNDGKTEEQAFKIAHAAARRAGDRDAVKNAKAGDSAQEMTMLKCGDCERQFFTEATLNDHAEAVHTHNEVHELLNLAIENKFGRRSYLHDVADDWVVFVTWSDYSDDRKMLKASYSLDEEGKVSFGEPSEVRRKTTYVDAPGDSADEDEAAQVGSKTAVHGTPATDLPHGFTQDEGSHPFFCSDCGRSRPHPLHNPPSAEGGGA